MQDRLSQFGLLWLRIFAGLGMAYHGYGKVFGGWMDKFVEGVASMGFPAPEFFAWAAALSEFAGGICLALGLFTRPAAFFIFCTMTVAALIRHGGDPLRDKELAILYLVLGMFFMLTGGGKFSLDAKCSRAST